MAPPTRKYPLMGWREWALVALLIALPVAEGVFGFGLFRGGDGDRAEPRATVSLVETLGGADTVGYARAVEPRTFVFPRDHGPHPDYRSEWWYFTGNLDGPDDRRFGFQFTIFRGALAPPDDDGGMPSESGEAWTTRQVYLGHFTVTDAAGGVFREFERYTRGAVGLAGARADPFRVWLDDWEVRGPAGGGTAWPMALVARDTSVALELRLEPAKPLVLQGEDGLSRKGSEAGNASYYYSYTRLAASGTVEIDGVAVPVEGTAWLDREWSTSALSDGQVGWDWFALQLSDGSDLMVYQLRRADGSPDPLSDGVRVGPGGEAVPLSIDEFAVEPTGQWTSPLDGAVYPSGWRIRVPAQALDLRVTPVLADQELDVSLRYWEGAVDVEGTADGRPVTGRGYVELTGYAEAGTGGRSGEAGGDG